MARKDSDEDKPEDKPENSEDNFGLPDIEYKPLDKPAGTTPAREDVAPSEPSSPYSASGQKPSSDTGLDSFVVDEPKSKAPVILGIVIVLVLLIAGYLIYNFVYIPRAEAEKARKEQMAKAALLKKQQEEARLATQREEEEKRRQEELANAKPAVGTIETLNGRTRRYYVVVSSVIDDDLLMDFAKKLSEKGVSTKIIPPFGGKKFYRLTIADHDTFALAQTNADVAKTDYGQGVWVIKY